ncbi:transcription activator-like protein [Senna tora]|uniref:Transcription activator-like protein n=1 Tax=Senna tora TaxID=362788 RepID=A0A834T9J4_9FABA|nr:transcription activator-like protein [Senna tora]
MKAVTEGAYGGGMYGTDDTQGKKENKNHKAPASQTQSADGPLEVDHPNPKHPPSSGDRAIDITGQSYIQ